MDGVINFQYSYSLLRAHATSTIDVNFIDVPDFLNENVTILNDTLADGDTWVINITAIDIMEYTLTEKMVIYIDKSQPLIQNMYLVRDNYKYLFVHNSTDLSEMDFYFEALDPHSGIRQLKWWLGTYYGGNDIGQGVFAVSRLQLNVSFI